MWNKTRINCTIFYKDEKNKVLDNADHMWMIHSTHKTHKIRNLFKIENMTR